jgi:acyl dehydratase
MMYFEEVVVGEHYTIGAHTFTADEIKRFASAFDPQPFHLDEGAAAQSHFGRLLASGWHTMAVWMRLNVREMQRQTLERKAAGKPVARAGPSPGFEQLKWLKPVYVGDTVSFETEIISTRASRSRPGWGVVSFRNVGRNQSDEDVVSFVGHVFVERRTAVAAETAEVVEA